MASDNFLLGICAKARKTILQGQKRCRDVAGEREKRKSGFLVTGVCLQGDVA